MKKEIILELIPFSLYSENLYFEGYKKSFIDELNYHLCDDTKDFDKEKKQIEKMKSIKELFVLAKKTKWFKYEFIKEEWEEYTDMFALWLKLKDYFEDVYMEFWDRHKFYDIKTKKEVGTEPFWLLEYFQKEYWYKLNLEYDEENYPNSYLPWMIYMKETKDWKHRIIAYFKDYTWSNWTLIAKFETKWFKEC